MFDLHPSHSLSIYKDVFFVCLITMSQIMFSKFLLYLPCFSYGACVHAKSLQSCPTLCDPMGCTGCPWGFFSQEYWRGCHVLLQEIFLTQGSNPGLLRCRQILYPLSYQGSPFHKPKAKLWVSFLSPLFPTHPLSKSSASPISSILICIPYHTL